ncbi:MAG: hypothetical protein RIC35_02530 [Marinoscillum sp.]
MSDEDVNKVHEDAQHKEQIAFNYTLAGKAADVGVVAKGSAANSEAENDPNSKKNQEKKFFEDLLKASLNTPADVENLLGAMDKATTNAQNSFNKAKEYKSAYESGDIDQLIILLGNDGYDTDILKSREDIMAAGKEQFFKHRQDEKNDIEFVKASGQKILDSDVSSEEQKQSALDKIANIEELERNMGSLDEIYEPTLEDTSELQNVDNKVTESEIDSFAVNEMNSQQSSDPFGETFSEVSDGGQRQTKSFAAEVDIDLFAETSVSIKDPFNEAAQIALKSDVEIKQEISQIKSVPTSLGFLV